MENLIAKTITFLVSPENEISVFFLAMFASLFVAGIYIAWQLRGRISHLRDEGIQEYEVVRTKLSPDMFIRNYLEKLGVDEGILEGIPDVFVSVGIVATFLGLGVAIQGAYELLKDETMELTQLAAVLEVIAFKFQTSVWGIIFSLIFRRFVVESYFSFRQEVIVRIRELLYEKERDGIHTLLEKQNALLCEYFRAKQDETVREHDELLKTISALSMKMEENRTAADTLIQEQFTELKADNHRLLEAALSYEKAARESEGAFSVLRHKDILDKNEQLAERISELKMSLENALARELSNLKYIVDNFHNFVNASSEFAQGEKHFAQSADNFSDRVDAFKADLSSFLANEFSSLREINTTLEIRQEEHIDKIDDMQSEIMSKIAENLNLQHISFFRSSEKYARDTEARLAELYENTFGSVKEEYIKEAQRLKHSMGVTTEGIEQVLSRFDESVKAAGEGFIREQRRINKRSEQLNVKMDEVLEKFFEALESYMQKNETNYENVRGMISDLKHANEETVSGLLRLLNTVEKSQRTASDAIENATGIVKKSASMNAAALAASNERLTEIFSEGNEKLTATFCEGGAQITTILTQSNEKLSGMLASSFAKSHNDFFASVAETNERMVASLEAMNRTLIEVMNLAKINASTLRGRSESDRNDKKDGIDKVAKNRAQFKTGDGK